MRWFQGNRNGQDRMIRIQTHLNLIQMGLNWDLVKGRSTNVEVFGGIPENDERIYGQGLRSRSEITKAWGNSASVF